MVVQPKRSFFLQVMCELKIEQIKRANTLFTNSSIGGKGRVCTITKYEISDEIPRCGSVQSNSID